MSNIEKLAKAIEASVIANWRHDMGDGNAGFNALTVAREILPVLRDEIRAELLGRIEAFTPSGADCHPESPHASVFKLRSTP